MYFHCVCSDAATLTPRAVGLNFQRAYSPAIWQLFHKQMSLQATCIMTVTLPFPPILFSSSFLWFSFISIYFSWLLFVVPFWCVLFGFPCHSFAVYVVCRRGNNSQLAVERMRTLLPPDWPVIIKDIVGGLQAWAEQVDPLFPIY